MGLVGYVVFGGFLVILLLIGILFSRQKDSSDFWVGGRSFGPFVLGIGITASIMHGGTLLSGVGLMAVKGPNVLNNLSFALGFFVVLVFLAKKLRKFGGYTIPDIMGARFESSEVRLVSAIIVLVASVVTLIAQTKSMGIVIGQILGISPQAAIVLSVIIFASYTIMGGMRGVIWTNIVQYAFMMLGVFVLAIAIFKEYGGMTSVMTMAEEASPGWTSLLGYYQPMEFISWHFVWFIAYFTRVEMVSKMYAAKDERTAKWSLVIGLIFLLLFINFTVYFSGAARALVMNNIQSSDQALTTLFAQMLSPTMASIALAGLAAAAMSTTDSLLLMSGSCIAHDILRQYIHKKQGVEKDETYYVKVSRATILVVSLITIVGALNTPGLILVITSYAVALTGASFACPMILGLNWKRTSTSAALASMIGGFLGSGLWAILSRMGAAFTMGVHPIIPGFVISMILIVLVTLSTKPVSDKTLSEFFPKGA
jgi:sodium/proline symporter